MGTRPACAADRRRVRRDQQPSGLAVSRTPAVVMRRAIATAMVVISVIASAATTARAQGWAADVSAGRLVYDPSAAQAGTNNVQGTLRFNTRRETWIYGTAALP